MKKSVKLKVPVQVGEAQAPITELHFRETVVAGDLRGIKMAALSDPSVDDVLKIAGRLAGQPDVAMNKLSLLDLGEVLEVVGPLLRPGPETGTGPSQS